MFANSLKVVLLLIVPLACVVGTSSTISSAQHVAQGFTVVDDIELTQFGDDAAEAIRFSPDGNYFAVYSERGHLNLNRVEDSLQFYDRQSVENLLKNGDKSQPPFPVWIVSRSAKEGPIIKDWRWLADSSGVAFLERTSAGNQRLLLAEVRKKNVELLASKSEHVEEFDIRDRHHYVYTVANDVGKEKIQSNRAAAAVLGSGRSLYDLILPKNQDVQSSRDYLWAVVDGGRFEVKNHGEPLLLEGDYALSPDGGSIVTKLPVPEVPSSWERLYVAPSESDPSRFHPRGIMHQYVCIDLRTGTVQTITDAPVSSDVDSWASVIGGPSWSGDGEEVLLPGTFLNSKDHKPSRPCVAVVDLPSKTATCVETLKARIPTGREEGYHIVKDARFFPGDKERITVSFYNRQNFSVGTTEYVHTADGGWQIAGKGKGAPEPEDDRLEVTVQQELNEPPRLVARKKQASRVIWDPNPQLKNIELGQASIYKWKDKEGRDRRGGLYKPANYKSGQRYPLVIQTHGFKESEFIPSGLFPTAFAARELAAAGILVLQVVDDDDCPLDSTYEGPCAVSGYESAANQLVEEGLVDPERIGIIGFSRTCFYVMETLTMGSSLHIKAASITDGVMEDYFQYIQQPERLAEHENAMIGVPPFGDGLQQWLKRSPGFNLDKVTAPLLVVAEGRADVIFMWQPYAILHYLQKPVELIVLNTDEHVLTNPAARMVSQSGSVDWFRFWLKNEEDPAPAKAEQYVRWRGLRKLQEENESKSTPPQETLSYSAGPQLRIHKDKQH